MFLADLPAAGPCDRLEEVVGNPKLKQAIGHQHVARAPAVVLADTDLLMADTDHSVAGDPPRNPLLAIALLTPQLPLAAPSGLESTRWGGVAQRLVRPLRVVVAHPLIECLLSCLQIPEHLPGVELEAEAAVEALDLARGGR